MRRTAILTGIVVAVTLLAPAAAAQGKVHDPGFLASGSPCYRHPTYGPADGEIAACVPVAVAVDEDAETGYGCNGVALEDAPHPVDSLILCAPGPAVSAFGDAKGLVAVTGTGRADGSVAASGTGPADGLTLAFSGTGRAYGTIAVSGTGSARGVVAVGGCDLLPCDEPLP
jgi:hypothetical protein